MTQAQANDLQTRWKQRGDPPPPCDHRTQALAYGYLAGMYFCLTCGQSIVHTHNSPSFPSTNPRRFIGDPLSQRAR